jgi:glycosyltransferase involved in cell wall biosynthesis
MTRSHGAPGGTGRSGQEPAMTARKGAEPEPEPGLRVCVVGSGTRFLSGISYFTHRLSTALAESHCVSVILIRRLMPASWYPGRMRVGRTLARFSYPASVPTLDGIDWYWGTSIVRAIRFLRRQRCDVLILQWWTGTVLHSYLLLAWLARRSGSRVVMEFHEVQDVGELAVPGAGAYVRALLPRLLHMVDAAVVHSEFDRALITQRFGLDGRPVALIPHGPYEPHFAPSHGSTDCEHGPCRILYFGVIRRYKGVEDLLSAFEAMDDREAAGYRLTIVGETWEGWELPARMIRASRHRPRIGFVNRYVSDDEAADAFAQADAVVLPYRRCSASGPLHMTMSHGLPVVVTGVGGLPEAVRGYEGAVLVPPMDPGAILAALRRVREMRGRRFADPHSWKRTERRYNELLAALPPRTQRART